MRAHGAQSFLLAPLLAGGLIFIGTEAVTDDADELQESLRPAEAGDCRRDDDELSPMRALQLDFANKSREPLLDPDTYTFFDPDDSSTFFDPDTYTIKIQRTTDEEALGIVWYCLFSDRIKAISQGSLVAKWNDAKTNPEEQVKVGDRISQVNGRPVSLLKHELTRKKEFEIEIQRNMRETDRGRKAMTNLIAALGHDDNEVVSEATYSLNQLFDVLSKDDAENDKIRLDVTLAIEEVALAVPATAADAMVAFITVLQEGIESRTSDRKRWQKLAEVRRGAAEAIGRLAPTARPKLVDGQPELMKGKNCRGEAAREELDMFTAATTELITTLHFVTELNCVRAAAAEALGKILHKAGTDHKYEADRVQAEVMLSLFSETRKPSEFDEDFKKRSAEDKADNVIVQEKAIGALGDMLRKVRKEKWATFASVNGLLSSGNLREELNTALADAKSGKAASYRALAAAAESALEALAAAAGSYGW